MKAEKLIVSTVETNIEITEVTLLSIEEYEACKDRVPIINDWWWLRSPGLAGDDAAGVYADGSIDYDGNGVNFDGYGIRPALRIRNLESPNLQIMDKFNLAGFRWTVISVDIALCDSFIEYMAFRKDMSAADANVYEASDIKKWLDRWVKENGIELVE